MSPNDRCKVHPDVPMTRRHDPFPVPLTLVAPQKHCWKCDEAAAKALRDAPQPDYGINRAI